ncbi:helix-turn-helix domain-containing protein [Kineothrix sp. MB12-C1]|uniref:helix-turn-helix domain-containing protein n=1 Tax=Kineothrix sp. MB12-C1 TaxID=3070215 RepID=UPI0027D2932C|nr:helix-turn-helix transcriptional regulator [Kineothrix sp. MB12-C1]WMC93213.1 helix-turn-helix transcriptional regulator [Kineothrix sp. MB12-C1]
MLNEKIKLNDNIRSFIRKERIDKNLITSDLSEAIGKTQGWLSQLENGRTVNITRADFINLISKIHNIANSEAELYIENYLNKEREKNSFQPNFKRKLFKAELLKQVNHSKYKINELEEKNSIESGTLQELCRNNQNIKPEERYRIAFNVFTTLDYINPKCMDTFLSMLGIPVPEEAKIYSFDDINQCYKIDSGFLVNWECNNWGEYLDYHEWELQTSINQMENQADETEYRLNEIEKKNVEIKEYPFKRKKELKDKLTESFSILYKIIDNIDINDYEKTLNSERYLETLIGLLTDSDGMKIFRLLFKYPIHKLDPKSLKDICELIDSKLDYEYHVHIKEDEIKEATSIDDLLEDYSFLACRYKPEFWGELNEMIDFTKEQ